MEFLHCAAVRCGPCSLSGIFRTGKVQRCIPQVGASWRLIVTVWRARGSQEAWRRLQPPHPTPRKHVIALKVFAGFTSTVRRETRAYLRTTHARYKGTSQCPPARVSFENAGIIESSIICKELRARLQLPPSSLQNLLRPVYICYS